MVRNLILLLLLLIPSSASAQVPFPQDCNDNDISDFEDLVSGSSQDCDRNGIPDECVGDGTERQVAFEKILQVEGTARRYEFVVEEIDSIAGRDLVAPAGDSRFMFVPNFENDQPISAQFYSTTPRLAAIQVADVDNSNGPDVITFSGDTSLDISVRRNTGNSGFGAESIIDTGTAISSNNRGVALLAAEFTGDPFADVIVGGTDPGSGDGEIALLTSAGDGINFVRSEICAPDAEIIDADATPFNVIAQDIDQDQDLDLVIFWTDRDFNTIRVCVNQGGGTFVSTQSLSVEVGSRRTGMTLADVNGDGDPDILIQDTGSVNVPYLPQLYLGAAGASFSEGIDVPSLRGTVNVGAIFSDFNNDGIVDFAFSDAWRIFRVLQGSETLEFSNRLEFRIPEEEGVLIGSIRAMVLNRNQGDEAFEIYALGQADCQRLRDCGQLVRGVGVRWPEVDGQELAELGYWRLGSEWLGWRDWWLARDEAE